MKIIEGNCTPKSTLTVELDPNPNGYPVLVLTLKETRNLTYSAFLDKDAVGKLLVELSERIGEM